MIEPVIEPEPLVEIVLGFGRLRRDFSCVRTQPLEGWLFGEKIQATERDRRDNKKKRFHTRGGYLFLALWAN